MHIRSMSYAAICAGVLAAVPASVQSATQIPAQFFAVLEAGNETSGGEAGGSGTATIIFTTTPGELCFAILVRNISSPNAAHIHTGIAGANGGIYIGLTAPSAGNPGASSGCITGVAATKINAIRNSPSKFYVNVHSAAASGGAIRGQLF